MTASRLVILLRFGVSTLHFLDYSSCLLRAIDLPFDGELDA
jgi:hypothetical protein